ncbi:putative WD-repeat protein [Phaeosphaeriaceae sp. SRC1lsM3a]|nr:putative WD-repeat protein [Stagonospora sp. SRC1lsM3a]
MTNHQPVNISNNRGRVGQQAGKIYVSGDNIIHTTSAQDTLSQLPHAADAPFNSYAKQHEPACLRDTRVDLLREIHSWADGEDERCIFWLSGLAGTGKSTIARTVARSYYDRQRLAASFFFSRGGGDIGHAGRFVTSLAVQLARNVPALRQRISDAVVGRNDIASQSLRDQWHDLVLGPLSKLSAHDCPASLVLVVDALDECDSDSNIRIIVQLLAEARTLTKARLRVLLTSRRDVPIRHGFYQVPEAEHQDVVLHNISRSIVDHDIALFLQHKLQLIARECCLDAGWPGVDIVTQLAQSASGLFIWAATACRFIREGKRFAAKRLDAILCNSGAIPTAPEQHLNKIYMTVLQNSIHLEHTDEEKKEQCETIRCILGSIGVLFSPLSVQSLDQLLDVTGGIEPILEDLHAILDIPNDQNRPLRLHHPSFRDFLLKRDRCGDEFWVNEKQAHSALAHRCVQLMSRSLKQDVCGVGAPGALVAEMDVTQLERCLLPELQYACLYWIQHLAKSDARLCDGGQEHEFLKEHCLQWLEALGWMGKVCEGIHAISSLESITLASECPSLNAFAHDMKRFAVYNRSPIELAPLQVYYSAIVFAPMKSILKRQFAEPLPYFIKRLPEVDDNWSTCLQTLEGHSSYVTSVAFSHDSAQLVSASLDSTVKIWDTVSGACLQTLKDHSGNVHSVTFSHDSTQLASASFDRTVKIWDVSSGACLQTLKGHTSEVNSVAFSPDSTRLVSAAADKTIKIWSAGGNACLQTLEGHSSGVNSVVFSPDSTQLASASSDRTVKIWDISSGACLQTLKGHSSEVNSVAFSPDSTRLVSAAADKTIKIWSAGGDAYLQTLEGHSSYVTSVVFSHDSTQLVSASSDTTVKIWDIVSGACLQTLKGHNGSLTSVAFSHNSIWLASASWDNTVKIWDASSSMRLETFKGHSSDVKSVAFSHDLTRLASASSDNTIKIWDTGSCECLQTFEGHGVWVYLVVFSHDSTRLVSSSYVDNVKIWDTISGTCLQTIVGHIMSVGCSHDSVLLALASFGGTFEIWDASGGSRLQALKSHSSTVHFATFSHDSTRLASVSSRNIVEIWDVSSGACLQTLEGYSSDVHLVAFSQNSTRLASASFNRTVKIWNTSSGACLQTLDNVKSNVPFHPPIFKGITLSMESPLTRADLIAILASLQSDETETSLQKPICQGISISTDGAWVTVNDQRLLWLPLVYRPICSEVSAALHLASDRHTVLLFAEYAVRERQVRRDTVGHGSSGQIGRAHRYRQAKAGKDRC